MSEECIPLPHEGVELRERSLIHPHLLRLLHRRQLPPLQRRHLRGP